MFGTKGRLTVSLLVVGLVVQGFLMPTTIESHSDNEEPYTNHYEVLESGWAICTPFYYAKKVGDWWYREYCIFAYYEKARWQNYHGVDPVTCSACGQEVDSSSEHWVSDSSCDWGGYYSCISSRSRCNEN